MILSFMVYDTMPFSTLAKANNLLDCNQRLKPWVNKKHWVALANVLLMEKSLGVFLYLQ